MLQSKPLSTHIEILNQLCQQPSIHSEEMVLALQPRMISTTRSWGSNIWVYQRKEWFWTVSTQHSEIGWNYGRFNKERVGRSTARKIIVLIKLCNSHSSQSSQFSHKSHVFKTQTAFPLRFCADPPLTTLEFHNCRDWSRWVSTTFVW